MLTKGLSRLFFPLAPLYSTRSKMILAPGAVRSMNRNFATLQSVNVTEEIQKLIQDSEAFCFDVDSTVITEEGIDSLAAFKGVGQQVADLTKR